MLRLCKLRSKPPNKPLQLPDKKRRWCNTPELNLQMPKLLGAVVFLGEPLGLHLLLGLSLVTAGILFGVRKAPLAKVSA